MRNSFEIMEIAWLTYAKQWRKLIVLPFGMFVASMVPALFFPWSLNGIYAAPNEQMYGLYILTQIIMVLVYVFLFYTYLLEIWYILTKKKYTHKNIFKIGYKRFGHTLAAHLVTILIILTASVAYIALYWLQFTTAVTTSTAIIWWPLILGLPLLAPGIYATVRFMPAVLTSAIDDTPVLKAFQLSSKLTVGRWWDTATRLFVPALIWTGFNLIIMLAVVIMLFLALSIDPTQFTTVQGYIVAAANGLIESLIFMPLTTISMVVLYGDLKK